MALPGGLRIYAPDLEALRLAGVTAFEADVLALMAHDVPDEVIAHRLQTSPAALALVVRSIARRLGAQDRAGLLARVRPVD